MTDTEKKDLILLAGTLIKNGTSTTEIEDENIIAMMKKIAANAVSMGLYNFNRFVISNIWDGEFNIDNSEWGKAQDNLFRYLEIIDNGGENLKDILSSAEIKSAIEYTIFENIGGIE